MLVQPGCCSPPTRHPSPRSILTSSRSQQHAAEKRGPNSGHVPSLCECGRGAEAMPRPPTHGAEPHRSPSGAGNHPRGSRQRRQREIAQGLPGCGCRWGEGSGDLAGGTGVTEEAVAAEVCQDVPGPDSVPGRAADEGAAPASPVSCADDE